MAEMEHWAPILMDKVMAKVVTPATPSGHAPLRGHDESGLDRPTERLETRGNYPGHTQGVSVYTKAVENPVLASVAVVGIGMLLGALAQRTVPHRAVKITGSVDATVAKALHIHLEARPGQEEEVERLLNDILYHVDREPRTGPWYGLRYTKRTFGIFEAFPDERARDRHLAGKGAALLIARSGALLTKPARIDTLDVLMSKEVFVH